MDNKRRQPVTSDATYHPNLMVVSSSPVSGHSAQGGVKSLMCVAIQTPVHGAFGGAANDLDGVFEMREPERTQNLRLAGGYRMESTIPSLFSAAENGDREAADALFSALYNELHRMARRELARQGAVASVSVTTLLHEAYLEISAPGGPSFPDRARFMGYAARVMRGLVIDHARSRNAIKRGGEFRITSLENHDVKSRPDADELSAIGDALDQLAKAEPSLAQLVELKFFCGFSFSEIGALHNVSERTLQRRWEKARIYLHRSIRADLPM
jgi:RNA polymerase sigma factor (TIGR02999 family)